MVDDPDADGDRPDALDRLLDVDLDDVNAEEGALTPEDLDIADREEVRRRGEDQFVVATDPEQNPTTDGSDQPRQRAGEGSQTADALTRLERIEKAYGMVLAAKTDAGTAGTAVTSNNIAAVFEDALRWYAGQVDDTVPPEEVISLLLDRTDLDVKT